MSYAEWALRHPQAAQELERLTSVVATSTGADGKSEEWAQQQDRLAAARFGALAWRNNVGATPAHIDVTCPSCSCRHRVEQRPIRYGLANDSHRLNQVIKSSDLILAIPRPITQEMVGTTIAQFGAVEEKKPGWHYTGKGRESAQQAYLSLVLSVGGFATFSTGGLRL